MNFSYLTKVTPGLNADLLSIILNTRSIDEVYFWFSSTKLIVVYPLPPLFSVRLHKDKSKLSQNSNQTCELTRKLNMIVFVSVLSQESGERRLRISLMCSVDSWLYRPTDFLFR